MKLLVCGGRNFRNLKMLDEAIRTYFNQWPDLIINGAAPGADKLSTEWAKLNRVHYAEVPALWQHFHNAAGPKRNSIMLLLNPDACLAMPGGSGTADMVNKCVQAGILTYTYPITSGDV